MVDNKPVFKVKWHGRQLERPRLSGNVRKISCLGGRVTTDENLLRTCTEYFRRIPSGPPDKILKCRFVSNVIMRKIIQLLVIWEIECTWEELKEIASALKMLSVHPYNVAEGESRVEISIVTPWRNTCYPDNITIYVGAFSTRASRELLGLMSGRFEDLLRYHLGDLPHVPLATSRDLRWIVHTIHLRGVTVNTWKDIVFSEFEEYIYCLENFRIRRPYTERPTTPPSERYRSPSREQYLQPSIDQSRPSVDQSRSSRQRSRTPSSEQSRPQSRQQFSSPVCTSPKMSTQDPSQEKTVESESAPPLCSDVTRSATMSLEEESPSLPSPQEPAEAASSLIGEAEKSLQGSDKKNKGVIQRIKNAWYSLKEKWSSYTLMQESESSEDVSSSIDLDEQEMRLPLVDECSTIAGTQEKAEPSSVKEDLSAKNADLSKKSASSSPKSVRPSPKSPGPSSQAASPSPKGASPFPKKD